MPETQSVPSQTLRLWVVGKGIETGEYYVDPRARIEVLYRLIPDRIFFYRTKREAVSLCPAISFAYYNLKDGATIYAVEVESRPDTSEYRMAMLARQKDSCFRILELDHRALLRFEKHYTERINSMYQHRNIEPTVLGVTPTINCDPLPVFWSEV